MQKKRLRGPTQKTSKDRCRCDGAKETGQIPYSDIVFLAHFTGGGIDGVLDLIVEDYFSYLDAAVEIYEKEITTPRRVVLSGIEKR